MRSTPIVYIEPRIISKTKTKGENLKMFQKIPPWADEEGQSKGQADPLIFNEGVQFWKVYFDFAYFTLVTPFRYVWSPENKGYVCYTNKFQTILHYILFVLLGIVYLLRLRVMWEEAIASKAEGTKGKENPSKYFDMAVYFFDSFFMLLLFLRFGRSRVQIQSVFQELELNDWSTKIGNNKKLHFYQKTKFWSTLILSVCMFTVLIKLFELAQDHNWNISHFFLFKNMESQKLFIFPSLVDSVPWLFFILNVGSTLYEKILNDFGDILFTMSVLLFNSLVNNFQEALKSEGDPNSVLNHYNWLKGITAKINLAIGIMSFAFIVGNLPFFATTVLEVFGNETKNGFVRTRYIVACCYFFPSICIGANANKKVEGVRDWICKKENYNKISEPKLSLFLFDLSCSSVGLTAYDIVTVNWSSVGSIISVILTYALLKTQFNMEPSCIVK